MFDECSLKKSKLPCEKRIYQPTRARLSNRPTRARFINRQTSTPPPFNIPAVPLSTSRPGRQRPGSARRPAAAAWTTDGREAHADVGLSPPEQTMVISSRKQNGWKTENANKELVGHLLFNFVGVALGCRSGTDSQPLIAYASSAEGASSELNS